jgi:hypothetical protein
MSAARDFSPEADVYLDIRPALRPDYAALPARQISAVAGSQPGLVALHRMLATPEPGHAALAVMLGDAGARRIRSNGNEIDVAAYLRLLSRLCWEAAEHAEQAFGPGPAQLAWEPVSEAWLPTNASTVPDPFPTQARQLSLNLAEPTMTGPMASVASDAGLSHLCAAVIDLADTTAPLPYAGFNDEEMIFVASLQKISALYAAFELRSRVRAQTRAAIQGGLATTSRNWQDQIVHDLETLWRPKLAAAFPGLPRGFPNIKRIFSFSDTGQVDFAAASPPVSIDQIDKIGSRGEPVGKFGDLMKMMLRWSNDAAASLCIRELSYPYINGVLSGAGFFDKTAKKGMWLSADFESNDWLPANKAGQVLTARWQAAQSRTRSNIAGTASQIARFMACLATDTLLDPVDPTATPAALHQEMRDLMSGTQGIGSYVATGLRLGRRNVTLVTSKIGLGDDLRSHDCAIVTSEPPNPPLRYVVVGLGGKPLQPAHRELLRFDLHKLFVRLHDIVSARHP